MASRGDVLIIVENLPVPFDRRVWMEATTLKRAGYGVVVICPATRAFSAPHEVIDGIDIHRHELPEGNSAAGYLKEYGQALLAEFRLARRVVREHRVRAVQICNPPDLLFLVALWVKLRTGARIIFDHHDLCPELYEAKYHKRNLWYWLLRFVERCTFAAADEVISTNESYRQVALTRGRKAPAHVTVVRSAPDLTRFQSVAPDVRFRNGRRHLVGYVGVMGAQEGIDVLLQAAHHIVRDRGRDDVQFVLIGSGPAHAEMVALRDDLGLQDHVELTGRIPEQELLARLSSCDICVNPDPRTPFNDRSTMNKIMEYMALGKPVVQFDLLEGRRSAGDASAYVASDRPADFGDAVLELLGDDARRSAMSRMGRERMVNQLEWRHQIPALLEVYARAVQPEESQQPAPAPAHEW